MPLRRAEPEEGCSDGEETRFTPHFSVLVGVLLAMVSLAVLIYFIFHLGLFLIGAILGYALTAALLLVRGREGRSLSAQLHFGTNLAMGLTAGVVQLTEVVRQANAGLLWTKQFYHYSVADWLTGDRDIATPPAKSTSPMYRLGTIARCCSSSPWTADTASRRTTGC